MPATSELGRFNRGIGMVVIVSPDDVEHLRQSGESAWRIGWVEAARESDAQVVIDAG